MKLTLIELLPNFIQKKLAGRDNLKKILGNTSWLFADRLLYLGIELFISVWIARYLGTEQFGLYSYVIAFVALFRAFASLGLDRIVVRYLVNSSDSKDKIK
jgi:PST family polysaccharide transporter